MFAPLRLKTPMTRNETLLMRISLPIGDASGKQVSLHGVADHAHLVAVADVAVGEHLALRHVLPIAHDQERRRCAVICSGTQLRLPYTICDRRRTMRDAR